MNLVLEMESSLEFWRRIYPAGRSPHNPIALPQGEFACSKKDVLRLAPEWATADFLSKSWNSRASRSATCARTNASSNFSRDVSANASRTNTSANFRNELRSERCSSTGTKRMERCANETDRVRAQGAGRRPGAGAGQRPDRGPNPRLVIIYFVHKRMEWADAAGGPGSADAASAPNTAGAPGVTSTPDATAPGRRRSTAARPRRRRRRAGRRPTPSRRHRRLQKGTA